MREIYLGAEWIYAPAQDWQLGFPHVYFLPNWTKLMHARFTKMWKCSTRLSKEVVGWRGPAWMWGFATCLEIKSLPALLQHVHIGWPSQGLRWGVEVHQYRKADLASHTWRTASLCAQWWPSVQELERCLPHTAGTRQFLISFAVQAVLDDAIP